MNGPSLQESAIIVGGGIVGIACAHYLSKAGMKVTVVERGQIAKACSHANCGYICPSHVLPLTEPGVVFEGIKSMFQPNSPLRVRPRLDVGFWNWMAQFARRCTHGQMLAAGHHLKSILDSSINEYRQLIPSESIDCEWRETGLMYVFETTKALAAFGKTDQLLRDQFGVGAERIDGADLADLEPALKPTLSGAYLYKGDASVRPDRLNTAWTNRLRERGVTFREQCEVQNIEQADGCISRIATGDGHLAADHFVFAAGAHSPQLSRQLGIKIPIEPGKGYSVTMERPDVCPTRPMLFPERRVGVSPFENGYRLGSMMEFVGYDSTIPDKRIEKLRKSAAPYLREFRPTAEQERWYGWRPMTWDSLPIIGRVPRLSNAYLATGHNMLGLSLAPATGRMIAEMVSGQAPHIDATPFSPSRF